MNKGQVPCSSAISKVIITKHIYKLSLPLLHFCLTLKLNVHVVVIAKTDSAVQFITYLVILIFKTFLQIYILYTVCVFSLHKEGCLHHRDDCPQCI